MNSIEIIELQSQLIQIDVFLLYSSKYDAKSFQFARQLLVYISSSNLFLCSKYIRPEHSVSAFHRMIRFRTDIQIGEDNTKDDSTK